MDSSEDLVGGLVFASEVPPRFDNPFVITVYSKMSASVSNPGDCPDEEFKTHGFCPSNVSSTVMGLPPRNKSPGSPSTLDGDSNGDANACIEESLEVMY